MQQTLVSTPMPFVFKRETYMETISPTDWTAVKADVALIKVFPETRQALFSLQEPSTRIAVLF